jgi:hypothetical protein
MKRRKLKKLVFATDKSFAIMPYSGFQVDCAITMCSAVGRENTIRLLLLNEKATEEWVKAKRCFFEKLDSLVGEAKIITSRKETNCGAVDVGFNLRKGKGFYESARLTCYLLIRALGGLESTTKHTLNLVIEGVSESTEVWIRGEWLPYVDYLRILPLDNE